VILTIPIWLSIIIWYFLACDKDIFVFLAGKKWIMEIEGYSER
jgi:hypothetical protein